MQCATSERTEIKIKHVKSRLTKNMNHTKAPLSVGNSAKVIKHTYHKQSDLTPAYK